jgi:hypothetical protein
MPDTASTRKRYTGDAVSAPPRTDASRLSVLGGPVERITVIR